MNNEDVFERIKRSLHLNAMDLDEELIQLPQLMLDAAEFASSAVFERDRAKAAMDIAMARGADALRTNLITDAKGQPKQRSEAQITSEVFLLPEVQKSIEAHDEAKFDAAQWAALVDGVRTKRDSLRIFAELTISGYLSPNAGLMQRRNEIRDKRQTRTRPQLNNQDTH